MSPSYGVILGAEFLAATGGDMAVFGTADHLAGFGGVTPVPRDSGNLSFYDRARAEGTSRRPAVIAAASGRTTTWGEGPMITATQGVKVTSTCVACGGVLVRDLGQFVDRGQLRSGIEGRCQACPDAWFRLATEEAGLVPVLRALREMRHLSLGEARLTAAELSGAGVVGTSVEMAHLAEGLRTS